VKELGRRKIQIGIRQAIGRDAAELNALFGSDSFHWSPEYRVLIDGEVASDWIEYRYKFDETFVLLAESARGRGHRIFPDQIRRVYDRVMREVRAASKKEAVSKYLADCESKGVPAKRKKLAEIKKRTFPSAWWYCAGGGMTNRKYKPVIIG
jgi:hypothetical protein